MLCDRYDYELTTGSRAARDAYVAASERMLEGTAGIAEGFERATREDPGFALAWVGLARAHQYSGNMAAMGAAIAEAQKHGKGVSDREASHLNCMGLLLSGRIPEAYPAIRAHVDAFPRDALVAQTCSSVFGLIGFSGQPGREAETLAFNAAILPHYGEDWWALSQYAFALCETGNLKKADEVIDRSLALNPRNAHAAHVRSHVSYEMGETAVGRAYLRNFLADYDPEGVMFCHLNWHEALWALEQGDIAGMWDRVDAAIAPEAGSSSPTINVLTDTAAILHRATMAGVEVSPDRWMSVSRYAQEKFPKLGTAFIDFHAALAHAMAGQQEALARIIDNPTGPTGDLVPDLARAFRMIAAEDWGAAAKSLIRVMSDHARLGGSRAQRDLVEQSLLTSLVKQGKREEAEDIAAMRRPLLAGTVAA
jgi:tetratricopeptide (TPR) repeat protein